MTHKHDQMVSEKLAVAFHRFRDALIRLGGYGDYGDWPPQATIDHTFKEDGRTVILVHRFGGWHYWRLYGDSWIVRCHAPDGRYLDTSDMMFDGDRRRFEQDAIYYCLIAPERNLLTT